MTDRASLAFEELRASFDPDETLARLAEKEVVLITLADEDYPELLKEIPDPPPALFERGEMPEAPGVALVGSRKASATGLDAAREIGQALGERGACVVSGLALGIDAAAHEGALEAGGPTVGVLGCGIDVVYPRRNGRLFERVREGGSIISEYYLGEAPLAWRFPARNRIIAGLGEHLVVVEAAERSGALITARHTLDSGREVWAVPGPLGVPECRGSNKLLADGAGVLWDVEEFADALVPQPNIPTGKRDDRTLELPLADGLPEDEALVLAGVGLAPTEVDVVAGRSGIEMRRLLSALSLLELKGYVTRNAGGAFVRRVRR
ncbi:MAG: DNA-processing protein DprA [Rubrobacteraceae bacterium]